MRKMNIRQLMVLCEETCDSLEHYNVGGSRLKEGSLKEQLRKEMLSYAIWIAEGDQVIYQEETDGINALFRIHMSREDMLNEYAKHAFEIPGRKLEIPSVLKYFVLADARKQLPQDETCNQRGQILTDTYNLLGQVVLACREGMTKKEAERLTRYVSVMQDFLEEYAVSHRGISKVIQPELTTWVEACEETISMQGTEKKEKNEFSEERLEEEVNKLMSLTGLAQVKKEVGSLINLIRVQKLREQQGMKNEPFGKHLVFSGNPGTGKTTVARMLAGIYKELGVLSKGHLVETDRSGMVSGYVGQTAIHVQEVIEQALGGILFIDEAYALVVNKGENDFGQEAVDTLLKAMEDHREDLVVIVAGYPDLMEQFLNSNPGLRSRFSHFVHFEDYSAKELLSILERMCSEKDYQLSEEAKKYCKEQFEQWLENPPENFANAREVRNYLDAAIANHASRVIRENKVDKLVLSLLIRDDFVTED